MLLSSALRNNIDSSVETVGERWLGRFSKCMIQREFRDSEGSEPVRLSYGDFRLIIGAFDDVAGKGFACPEIVEQQLAVSAQRKGDLARPLVPQFYIPHEKERVKLL